MQVNGKMLKLWWKNKYRSEFRSNFPAIIRFGFVVRTPGSINKNWQFVSIKGPCPGNTIDIYSNVLYTELEIGSRRAKNGEFHFYVYFRYAMSSRDYISLKRAVILNSITQYWKRRILCAYGTIVAIYSNVLYTVLEIGSGRAINGVFLDFVCHDIGTKMFPRAKISGKRAAILNNITQFWKSAILCA